MKILCLGSSLEMHVGASSYYFYKKLAEIEELIQYGPPSHLSSSPFIRYPLLSKIPLLPDAYDKIQRLTRPYMRPRNIENDVFKLVQKSEPDVILLSAAFPPRVEWKNLYKVKIPKVIVISDPHKDVIKKLEYVAKNKIDLALMPVIYWVKTDYITKFIENQNIEYKHFPWCVDIDVFKDYNLPYMYDVVSSGTVSKKSYPLRYEIRETLSKMPDIKFYMPEHASFSLRRGRPMSKVLIRENYAKFLSQSKIFIFGSSIYNYPLMKYFEGMACNTLVMAPMPEDGKELHFIPGENFVEINRSDYLEKIRYYLNHESERRLIVKKGMETIEKYHTVNIRVNQLLDFYNNLL